MDPPDFLCWRLTLLLLLSPSGFHCLSVHITNQEPVHVISGSVLVLQAQIEHGPMEEVSMVTWEREPETGTTPGRVTLATCPGKSATCAGERLNILVKIEHQKTTLQITEYHRQDGGVYSVTVTNQTGSKSTAQCIVREYEAVHHVSVSINTSHSILVCGEAWGTDPRFNWLHDRVTITKAVGRVSADGMTLVITMTPICGHFTCMVSNKLGYSSASYAAAPCEMEGGGTTAAVVCLVVLLLCAGALALLLWYRRRQHNNRRERLHEDVDDKL
ncbi:uncharacterized protein si:dkeyp-97a10.2 [Thalassophryne amazonica]|uniref:uncharacterized protein si:dkeyp-97a10.2 n=1 Tax=Thalassophryne amazonica TaxID=390379 RepID=UPI00147113D1|nr:uncharacterized protein si:dkeyp-97a10.2 [Thalassophryne amazonica]XP_034030020.1 uncharacterized protein si:dkeyp-97a10.2 [Thalassophryne amazonica]